MNVTCEVTPHHLFLDEAARQKLGDYGCVKPSLKPQADVDFLWENMYYIDIFASDCAPHRPSDKAADPPAFGITNHTLMLPLLLGAVADERLTMNDIYQKFCVAPRQRFNLRLDDNSSTDVDPFSNQQPIEHAPYSHSPFVLLGQRFYRLGVVMSAQAGVSGYHGSKLQASPSYSHLIRPKNLRDETTHNE
jgi:dihydroorotase